MEGLDFSVKSVRIAQPASHRPTPSAESVERVRDTTGKSRGGFRRPRSPYHVGYAAKSGGRSRFCLYPSSSPTPSRSTSLPSLVRPQADPTSAFVHFSISSASDPQHQINPNAGVPRCDPLSRFHPLDLRAPDLCVGLSRATPAMEFFLPRGRNEHSN